MVTFLQVRELPIGSAFFPQSGFFPLLIGLILLLFSIILFIKVALGKKETEESQKVTWVSHPGGWKILFLTVGCLFAYGFFLETLGFLICTFLLMGLVLLIFGIRRWSLILTMALGSDFVSYLLFRVVLKCPLPSGILG